MKPINQGVLSTIGNTPLVQLTRVLGDCQFRLFAKLEGFNPGGSIKDRPALRIIQAGIEDGSIRPETTIIESSSGNLGIGLAQICLYLGLRFICVIDPKTTAQNRRLLRAYGAELDMVTEPDPETGEFLIARLERVRALLHRLEDAFWPNQYVSLFNAASHRRTMEEIVDAFDGKLDYLFCPTSTCGTLRGCAEFARDNSITHLRIVAVDAVGSVIFGGANAKRLIPGHGASIRPPLYQPGLAHEHIHVTDFECIAGCRMLLAHEALLAGGSSGATIMAINRMRSKIPAGANVVLIFPDRGERYLDTVFSDAWVSDQFGELPQIDQRPVAMKVVESASSHVRRQESLR
jgi:N-(2-amino-2-carboxyethyl)-L-glutamate synthase